MQLNEFPAYARATASYRDARADLINEERALLDHIERVAEQRRHLPEGPSIDDVTLECTDGSQQRLSNLVGQRGTLIAYNMMFGPGDDVPCRMCMRWVDGFNALAPAVREVVPMVIFARREAPELARLARSRGWTIPLYHAPQSYGRDVGAEDSDGDQIPLITVFRKDPSGKISLWYAQAAEFPDGTNRGIDLLNPLWALLDLAPEGRGDYVPSEVVHTHA